MAGMLDNVFVKAALLTAVVFSLGVFVGVWLDVARLDEVTAAIEGINDRWSDARMQTMYYQIFEKAPGFCDAAMKSNLDFNAKIYEEGAKIERYESVNKFTPSLLMEKRRYALLQLQFWMNSIQLREACDTDYNTLVYLYSVNESFTMDQHLQSAVLLDAKDKCGPGLMLTPLPADIGIETIELVKSNFGITQFPALIVNERVVLQGLQTEKDLAKYLDCLQ